MASVTTAEISRRDLLDLSIPSVASITDVKHLSSYNWLNATTPTIAVPGSPPLWSPPTGPQRLRKDSGLIYISQNAARHPESPLEPLFRALYISDPVFDIRSIDVVTDRNNIRKLLSFVNPESTRNGLDAFTIHIEVTQNTAIFSREETVTHEVIGPHEFRGFGHEFEKAYTTSQIRRSTGHHRVISYRFGGMSFVVRHETDGYVHADPKIPSSGSKELKDDILTMLESLSLSPTKTSPNTTPTKSTLTVEEEGQAILIESTLEIKTRVAHKPLLIDEVAPQLWISQTPKLVRAYHYKGMFQVPKVENVASEIKKWEKDNQKDLCRLAALIKRILNVTKGCGGKAMVKYDNKRDVLVVRKVDGKAILPEDLYSRWDDSAASDLEAGVNHDVGAENVGNVIE